MKIAQHFSAGLENKLDSKAREAGDRNEPGRGTEQEL
jgi:hypothetical protein